MSNSMTLYYMRIAMRSFLRNPALTALMVVAIATGVAACVTTLTVFRVLTGDPVPGESDQLFYPQLDPRPLKGYSPGTLPEVQMTRRDAETLLRDAKGDAQAMMTGGAVYIDPRSDNAPVIRTTARYTSSSFFSMFRVPFIYGSGWSVSDEEDRSRVVVISKGFNKAQFGGGNSVGRELTIEQTRFRVIGVLDDWRPIPKFYDLTTGRYGESEKVFLPFATAMDLKFKHAGNTSCWNDPGVEDSALDAPCTWVQYWVRLTTPDKVRRYKEYLEGYARSQHDRGRFQRPANVRLSVVADWLSDQRAVPDDVKLQVWISLGFLFVCVLNTTGLLLAKFLRRTPEFVIRRALGATRFHIFSQCLIECLAVGAAGGALGLALSSIGLWLVRMQPAGYAGLARMDASMSVIALLIALVASLAAGLIPAMRVCGVTPSLKAEAG